MSRTYGKMTAKTDRKGKGGELIYWWRRRSTRRIKIWRKLSLHTSKIEKYRCMRSFDSEEETIYYDDDDDYSLDWSRHVAHSIGKTHESREDIEILEITIFQYSSYFRHILTSRRSKENWYFFFVFVNRSSFSVISYRLSKFSSDQLCDILWNWIYMSLC